MTSQIWEKLGLPINLYNLIRDKYDSILGMEKEKKIFQQVK